MTVRLYNSWRMSELQGGSGFDIRIIEDPGGTPDNNDVTSTSSTLWMHYDASAVLTGQQTLASWLETQLDAGTSNAFNYGVSFDEDTGFITISTQFGDDFDIEFNNADTRTLMGFATDQSGSWTYTGTQRCEYFILAAMAGYSLASDDYTQRETSAEAIIDDGSGVSVKVGTPATFHRFLLQHETHEATASRKAAATVPWTYQHMVEHSSSKFPFLMRETLINEDIVMRLRGSSSSWGESTRSMDTADDFSSWTMHFEAQVLGRL